MLRQQLLKEGQRPRKPSLYSFIRLNVTRKRMTHHASKCGKIRKEKAMLDNMIGDIARAMQDDRRAEAMKQMRLVEAEQARLPYAHGVRLPRYRAAIAAALMALAMRLAPSASAAAPRSEMATPATH
jgi:hypothetical protein